MTRIGLPTLDHVVPPSRDVSTWKLVSLVEESTHDITAVVALDLLTATAAGGVTPAAAVPISDTVCVAALDELAYFNVNVPDVCPPLGIVVGLKVVVILQLALTAKDAGQLLVSLNCVDALILLINKAAGPLFVKAIDCGALTVLMVVAGNVTLLVLTAGSARSFCE